MKRYEIPNNNTQNVTQNNMESVSCWQAITEPEVGPGVELIYLPSGTPLKKTGLPSPSRYRFQIASWLGVEFVPTPPSLGWDFTTLKSSSTSVEYVLSWPRAQDL